MLVRASEPLAAMVGPRGGTDQTHVVKTKFLFCLHKCSKSLGTSSTLFEVFAVR